MLRYYDCPSGSAMLQGRVRGAVVIPGWGTAPLPHQYDVVDVYHASALFSFYQSLGGKLVQSEPQELLGYGPPEGGRRWAHGPYLNALAVYQLFGFFGGLGAYKRIPPVEGQSSMIHQGAIGEAYGLSQRQPWSFASIRFGEQYSPDPAHLPDEPCGFTWSTEGDVDEFITTSTVRTKLINHMSGVDAWSNFVARSTSGGSFGRDAYFMPYKSPVADREYFSVVLTQGFYTLEAMRCSVVLEYQLVPNPTPPVLVAGSSYLLEDFFTLQVNTLVSEPEFFTPAQTIRYDGDADPYFKEPDYSLCSLSYSQLAYTDRLQFALGPVISDQGGLNEFTGLYPGGICIETTEHGARDFYRHAKKVMPRLIGAAAFSFDDAMSTYVGGLDNNYIETISEIQTILAPLDLPPQFWEAVVKASRANSKVSAVVTLLTFLASANLCYKFGLAPNISAAEELSQKGQALYRRIGRGILDRKESVQGKARWDGIDIGWTYPVNLQVRTTVVLRPKMDSMLPYILPAEQLGIMPKLSRMWETLPWTWLIDYAIPVKKTLSFIDTSLFTLMYQIEHSTSTYRVDYPFSVHNLEVMDCIGNPDDPPSYRLFSRLVLPGAAPLIGPMLPELLFNPRVPSWDIVGSILIQRVT